MRKRFYELALILKKTYTDVSYAMSVKEALNLLLSSEYCLVIMYKLTRTEFDLLLYMVKHPNQIFSRQQLYRQVWGDEPVHRGFWCLCDKKATCHNESVEKLVRKYYRPEEKQRRILEMIHRKLDTLGDLEKMFSSYSRLYLYEKGQNRDSEFQSDYLLVHENGKKILHLGLIKSERGKDLYHCNSFMTTYQNDRDRDSFFRDLPHCYEIIKVVGKNKDTKQNK